MILLFLAWTFGFLDCSSVLNFGLGIGTLRMRIEMTARGILRVSRPDCVRRLNLCRNLRPVATPATTPEELSGTVSMDVNGLERKPRSSSDSWRINISSAYLGQRGQLTSLYARGTA